MYLKVCPLSFATVRLPVVVALLIIASLRWVLEFLLETLVADWPLRRRDKVHAHLPLSDGLLADWLRVLDRFHRRSEAGIIVIDIQAGGGELVVVGKVALVDKRLPLNRALFALLLNGHLADGAWHLRLAQGVIVLDQVVHCRALGVPPLIAICLPSLPLANAVARRLVPLIVRHAFPGWSRCDSHDTGAAGDDC